MKQVTLEISTHRKVKALSKKTGIKIKVIVDEAIKQYLKRGDQQ